MTVDPRRRRVIIGVDTHKYVHVAVALDIIGGVIDSRSFAADSGGYEQLITWALDLGLHLTFAIEGTGSYGAGLTSAVRRRGVGTVEVMRTDRRDRRLRGKSDTLDAENAARAVLSGNATTIPKTNDGTVEMIRQVKIAKDLAVKGRSAAIISLKTINAMAESFFATLKTEFYYRRVWATKARAKLEVGAWIEERYNRRRRHSAIGQISPVAFELQYSNQTVADQEAA